MKSIKLSDDKWSKLRSLLQNDHGHTFLLIKNKPLREYGFTVRNHTYYDITVHKYQSCYYLDVFDESKITLFLLKYSDFL